MVAVFSSIYTLYRLGQVAEDQGTDFDFKILIGIFFMQILVLTYIYLQNPSDSYKAYLLGPIFLISWVDSRWRYIYDIDLCFLLIVQLVVGISFGTVNLIEYFIKYGTDYVLYYGREWINLVLGSCPENLISSLIIFALTLSLSKIKGAMGGADPYLYFIITLHMGYYATTVVFFLSYMLAASYLVINYFIYGELEERVGLGPFICMAFIL